MSEYPETTTSSTVRSTNDIMRCYDIKLRNTMMKCPPEVSMVCGCDGVEYVNSCNAVRAGLTSWTKGHCPSNQHYE
jgi:hypothetical protein